MKNLPTILYFSIAMLALSPLTSAQAQTLAQWTFENDAIGTNNSPATSSGSGTADSIGMNIYPTPNVGVTQDDVLQGATGDTGSNGVADINKIWRVRGQGGSNGAANGWSSLAPIGTQGAQFFTSTAGYASGVINVSFDWYSTTQGEANMQFEYTTNGGTTWNNLALTLGGSDAGLKVLTNTASANTVNGSYVSDNKANNGSNAGQEWFTGLTATIADVNAQNDAGFGIEMVNASTGADDVSTQGTALNNNSGNWRFDNVTVTEAPEPGTDGLLMTGLLLIAGFYIRRHHSLSGF